MSTMARLRGTPAFTSMVMNVDILSFSFKVCAAVKMSAISFRFDNSGSGKLVISGDCLAGGVTSLSSSVNCLHVSSFERLPRASFRLPPVILDLPPSWPLPMYCLATTALIWPCLASNRYSISYQTSSQPAGSWKLKAKSLESLSVQTIRVSIQ